MMAANSSDEEADFGTPEGQMLDDSVSSSGDEKNEGEYGDEEGEDEDDYDSEDMDKMKKREMMLAGSDSDGQGEPSDVDMDSEDLIK